MQRFLLLAILFLFACDPVAPPAEGEGEGEGDGEGEGEGEGGALFERLSGLWAGPADSQTSLGDFPIMSMDHRPADNALFARGDLDEDNAIRWWLWLDDDGALRFDNGGLFRGFRRSDSCVLETASEGVFRFCHADRGCAHIDASFAFDGPDALTLTVVVDGDPHVTWDASRVEARDLPAGFPQAAQAGEPGLPSLSVSASWSQAAGADANAWLVLTASECGFTFACDPARTFKQALDVGAQTASFTVDEVHPGDYFAFLLIDSDGDFETTLRPNAGDLVSLPDRPVTVDAAGGSLSIAAGPLP